MWSMGSPLSNLVNEKGLELQIEQDPTRLLRSFLDISLQIAEGLDVQKVLRAIVDRAMDVTGAQQALAVTLHSDGHIENVVHRGTSSPVVADDLESDEGLLAYLLDTHTPIRLSPISDHSGPVGRPFDQIPMDAFVGLPIQHRGQLAGALCLTRARDDGPFEAQDEHFLEALAAMAAVAIDNARLFTAETSRAERAALLRHVASKVRRSLDLDDVLTTTAETLGRAAKVDRCFIRLITEDDPAMNVPVAEWVQPPLRPFSETQDVAYPISDLAARTRSTQWTADMQNEPAFSKGLDELPIGVRAVLSAPLEWGDELLGVVTFDSAEVRDWTPSDRALIEAAAREVSIAINHARLYEEAIRTNERLRELDEMRSDFISMVSHELRSPMTVVAGIADILAKRRQKLSEERQTELISTLGREARRLTRLVSEVLDLESIDQGRMELHVGQVDVSTLGTEAIADAGEAHRTKLVVEPGNMMISGDYDKLKQVLLNLISNAAKFSGENKPITVAITPRKDGVMVAVKDEGPGIPDEYQSRLFQRFSRVQSTGARKPGSGLGLYLARIIIEGHGGEIWCESTLGEGATFTFRIPR